jgi:hypothetical protein
MILEAPIPEINSGSIGHLIVICHGLWGIFLLNLI